MEKSDKALFIHLHVCTKMSDILYQIVQKVSVHCRVVTLNMEINDKALFVCFHVCTKLSGILYQVVQKGHKVSVYIVQSYPYVWKKYMSHCLYLLVYSTWTSLMYLIMSSLIAMFDKRQCSSIQRRAHFFQFFPFLFNVHYKKVKKKKWGFVISHPKTCNIIIQMQFSEYKCTSFLFFLLFVLIFFTFSISFCIIVGIFQKIKAYINELLNILHFSFTSLLKIARILLICLTNNILYYTFLWTSLRSIYTSIYTISWIKRWNLLKFLFLKG